MKKPSKRRLSRAALSMRAGVVRRMWAALYRYEQERKESDKSECDSEHEGVSAMFSEWGKRHDVKIHVESYADGRDYNREMTLERVFMWSTPLAYSTANQVKDLERIRAKLIKQLQQIDLKQIVRQWQEERGWGPGDVDEDQDIDYDLDHAELYK